MIVLALLFSRSSLTGEDMMVLILLWFVCFNGSRFASDVFDRYTSRSLILLISYYHLSTMSQSSLGLYRTMINFIANLQVPALKWRNLIYTIWTI